jgi:sodium/hydrogen antiporter
MFAGKKKEKAEALPLAPESLPESIELPEMQRLQSAGEPVVILDVRTLRSLESSDLRAVGAVRVDPEQPAQEAERLKLPKEAWLIAFCA